MSEYLLIGTNLKQTFILGKNILVVITISDDLGLNYNSSL